MEPVVLVCEGCGVRIRTSDPEKARGRPCPRCQASLEAVINQAMGSVANPSVPTSEASRPPTATPQITKGVLAILITVASLASLVVRDASTGSNQPTPPLTTAKGRPESSPLPTAPGRQAATEPQTSPLASLDQPSGPPGAVPELSVVPTRPSADLALLDRPPADDPLVMIDTAPGRRPSNSPSGAGPPPSPPMPRKPGEELRGPTVESPPRLPVAPVGDRRLLIRDGRGQAIVAREYGSLKGRVAAILPDGQIGWPESLVVTQDPFVPATLDEMKRTLLSDPEYAAFRFLQTTHYLVMYQGTESFARASADLLERLHDGLTGTLKKNGLPVQPIEFPLVAVIYATEDDFRENRRVAADVQAVYDILSNRIFFYERSRRDQDSPEVSALRKPQTVAHEGTHQILHNVGIQPRLSDWPLWLVEGLAEYCSPPKQTRKGVDWAGLGQVNPIHLATIRDLEDPLPDQLRGDHAEAIGARDRRTPLVEYLVTRKELTPTDYALSWALTHYLATQRLDDFVAYIKRMSQLQPFEEQSPSAQLATFREVFGNDLAQMDGKVGKYLKKFKQADALPHYAVVLEQPIDAQRIRRHYMVSQSPSVIRQWVESIARPEGGQPHWQFLALPTRKKAVETVEQWMSQAR